MAKQTDRIEMSWIVDAKPKEVYAHWLDSEGHGAMTGGRASVDPRVRSEFTAWDGYIHGVTTALEKNRRIVQTWRTSQFTRRAPDSRIEVKLRAIGGKTQVTLVHTKLVPGDGARYTAGWFEHYARPMVAYFEKRAKAR